MGITTYFSYLKTNSNKKSRFLLLFCLSVRLLLFPLLFPSFQRIDQPGIGLFGRLVVWHTLDLYQVILPPMDVIESPTPFESACYLVLTISGIILELVRVALKFEKILLQDP